MPELQYIVIAILHGLFLLCLYFLASKLFKAEYKTSVLLTLMVGVILGITIDFIGVIIFNLWQYPIASPVLYFFVLLGWYIPAMPVCVLLMDRLINFFTRSKSTVNLLPKSFYLTEIFTSGIIAIILGVWRYESNNSVAPLWFFPVMLILAIFLSDGFLGMLKKPGLITYSLKAHFLIFFAPFISGFLVGIFAESLNFYLSLYQIVNVPADKIFNIPISALVGWGIVNLGYWTILRILLRLKGV